MSNIFNHNRIPFDVRINRNDYWDFQLSLGGYGGYEDTGDGLETGCLAAYIDTSDPDCVWFDSLFSNVSYLWDGAVNSGLDLKNIGYTGVDNGIITFEKDTTSNEKFLELFRKSEYKIEKEDKRLHLNKVNGNNQIYSYDNDIVEEDGKIVARLNGGFYQGFYKSGNDYNILPLTNVGEGKCFEFVLKKTDLEKSAKFPTLNETHPDNKGMFFYIGTRAENKWWLNYNSVTGFDKSNNSYMSGDYVKDEYLNNDSLNTSYLQPYKFLYGGSDYFANGYLTEKCEIDGEKYFSDDYISNDYYQDCGCDMYVSEEYIKDDVYIDVNEELKTTDEHSMNQPNVVEIKTDNKFILFDRTCDGFTIRNWAEGSYAVISDIKVRDMENGFLLYDRTCHGHTFKDYQSLIAEKSKRYNTLFDLYRNALGFQIKDDGTIGYKYIIKDCDSEEEAYKVESEFTVYPVIKNNEWFTVHIKVMPVGKPYEDCVETTSIEHDMQISIYVNGKLVLMSKYLPTLNIKKLNDTDDKQESVPFNISLGGGTQGLCDVIYLNYRKIPEYVLPLEKEFTGSFIGYLKTFRFYNCPLNLTKIRKNAVYDRTLN